MAAQVSDIRAAYVTFVFLIFQQIWGYGSQAAQVRGLRQHRLGVSGSTR